MTLFAVGCTATCTFAAEILRIVSRRALGKFTRFVVSHTERDYLSAFQAQNSILSLASAFNLNANWRFRHRNFLSSSFAHFYFAQILNRIPFTRLNEGQTWAYRFSLVPESFNERKCYEMSKSMGLSASHFIVYEAEKRSEKGRTFLKAMDRKKKYSNWFLFTRWAGLILFRCPEWSVQSVCVLRNILGV